MFEFNDNLRSAKFYVYTYDAFAVISNAALAINDLSTLYEP